MRIFAKIYDTIDDFIRMPLFLGGEMCNIPKFVCLMIFMAPYYICITLLHEIKCLVQKRCLWLIDGAWYGANYVIGYGYYLDRHNVHQRMKYALMMREAKRIRFRSTEGQDTDVYTMLHHNALCSEGDKNAALCAAVEHNNIDLVALLLQQGACVHSMDKHYYSALSLACGNRHMHKDMVIFLLKNNADVYGPQTCTMVRKDTTALYSAVASNHY